MPKKNTKKYIVAGLTGGIASGKSTIGGFFSGFGAKVIDADAVARKIVQPGQPALKAIADTFGREVLLPNGQLNRPALAEIIFGNAAAKTKLDSITHPIILAEMQQQTARLAQKKHPVIIWEVPLLFESGFYRDTDVSILVYTPENIQLERLMTRDGISKEQALQRINSQMPLQQKKELATIIIENDGDLGATEKVVGLVYNNLLGLLNNQAF